MNENKVEAVSFSVFISHSPLPFHSSSGVSISWLKSNLKIVLGLFSELHIMCNVGTGSQKPFY